MAVNEDNAYRITEELSFPRLIGSEGEKRAIQSVINEFQKAGYQTVLREKFKTSFYNWILIRFLFIPIGFLIILMSISIYINPFLTIAITLINFFITSRALKMATSSKIKLMKDSNKNYETENIYVNLKNNNAQKKIVLMAHWDSKSQVFPSSFRILIFIVSVFGFLSLFMIYLILSIIQLIINFRLLLLNHILLSITIIIVSISLLNYFNKTGNNSPGAYDNASGVGVVIELARFFKVNPLKNINFIFLCTSSEELNLGGSKNFIHTHKSEFDSKNSYFINFDLIGGSELIRIITSFGIPRKISSKKLNKLFLESAEELNINAKDVYLPTGAWSDYMPIVQEGFDACWIASQPGLKLVHTKKDTMSMVSKDSVKNTLLLCVDVIKKINDESV
jgi:hypothetical protein